MADTKISNMTAATSVADADLVPIVQGGANKKATAGLLRNLPTGTPASSSAAGVTGTILWDGNNIYVCVATNTWRLAPLSDF